MSSETPQSLTQIVLDLPMLPLASVVCTSTLMWASGGLPCGVSPVKLSQYTSWWAPPVNEPVRLPDAVTLPPVGAMAEIATVKFEAAGSKPNQESWIGHVRCGSLEFVGG